MSEIRPRRSVLYVPGSNPRALDKGRSLAADGLILDFEDAVAPAAKAQARANVADAVTQGGYGNREIIVRINGLDTPWGAEDIECVASIAADAILLPKVDGYEEIEVAATRLDRAGAYDLPIWIMAETPRGVLALDSIAEHPRVAVIVMGTADLAAAMRLDANSSDSGVQWALGRCVMAARAHGLDILAGVSTDLENDAGFKAACADGRRMGFDGKTLIHPRQIEAANAAFGVLQHDIDQARGLLDAWSVAEAQGLGVTVFEGRLVEALHAAQAQRTLAIAAATARLDKEA